MSGPLHDDTDPARAEQEPVTITDKRRVDPDTGKLRTEAPDPATDPTAADPNAAAPGATEAEAEQSDSAAGDPVDGGDATAAEEGQADSAEPSAEVAELTADLQRAHADFANYRRRVERDRQSWIDNAKSGVLAEFLVVLDDLDRAKAHGDLEAGPLKAVADKLDGIFKANNLEAFGAAGDPFDPAIHEAVQHEGSGTEPVVGSVLRQGYRIGDKVLRTALVAVTDA